MTYLIFAVLTVFIIGATRKEVEMQETVPGIYGAAYYKYNALTGVCYPIPLNILMAQVYKVYAYFRFGKVELSYKVKNKLLEEQINNWAYSMNKQAGILKKAERDRDKYKDALLRYQPTKRNVC